MMYPTSMKHDEGIRRAYQRRMQRYPAGRTWTAYDSLLDVYSDRKYVGERALLSRIMREPVDR